MERISPLLTDLYQLAMAQAYLERGMTDVAVFEFFVRKLPDHRAFLVAAGLEQALEYLETFGFSDEETGWLRSTGRFKDGFLEELNRLRFTGDVEAMTEGTLFFQNEPILRVIAPLPQAQLVETRLINILHFQSLIASKAARFSLLAPGKQLIDFGLRRAHGAEAGLMAARASYIGGFDGTATLLANRIFGIPVQGTMAHSFIQAFDDESDAFEAFARSRPHDLVLLIDTYDTEEAARKVVHLAPKLKAEGIRIRGVRIDSGDLGALAVRVRRILDEGGLKDVGIIASGGIGEQDLIRLVGQGAPIAGFGIGTELVTSSDVPALDCAYKLQEYAGIARRKHSSGKETWPGRKQVWRRFGPGGVMQSDLLGLMGEDEAGEALLHPVMRQGRKLVRPSLLNARKRLAMGLKQLPAALRRLEQGEPYPVEVSVPLQTLAEDVDRRLRKSAENEVASAKE
jgi:nicotinate phosphoribosyltransferase